MTKHHTYTILLSTCVSALLLVKTGTAQNVTNVTGVAPPADRIGLAPFRQGFAAITLGSERFYMDIEGETIRLFGNAVLGDDHSVGEYEREMLETEKSVLPPKKIIFEKDDKR